jgi:predicted O-methyltransferase YrrM
MKDYLQQINPKESNPVLVSLRAYAEEHNVPIIRYDGLQLLRQIILLRNAKKVLEIGTAIGYSAIAIALHTDAHVTTIERNQDMIQLAKKNIKEANLENRITVIEGDALEVDENLLDQVDVIFIDAAKSQSAKFFLKYKKLLTSSGVIITDNILFHGLVVEPIRDRNLRQLVGKIDRFNKFVIEQEDFDTYIYHVGDGMSISIKKD